MLKSCRVLFFLFNQIDVYVSGNIYCTIQTIKCHGTIFTQSKVDKIVIQAFRQFRPFFECLATSTDITDYFQN